VKRRTATASVDIPEDPFGEKGRRAMRWRARVLGASIEFSSNRRELLRIAREAFARVPPLRWPHETRRTLRISLQHVKENESPRWTRPPKPVLSSGAGLLCAHIDACNYVIIDTRSASALVQVGDSMLSHRQLVRYEMIEFAAIMLATREQGLVALHAGCVGAGGRGVLLLGASGTGKSTLTLNAALDGLDFLAEDSVFVHPETLRATGLSAYTHAREDALALIGDPRLRRAARRAPRIERRSGVRKREIDLRDGPARLASAPLRIVSTVVLSARPARGSTALVPLSMAQLKRVLRAEQPFAAARPGWREFERRVLRAGGFRLHRTPPRQGARCLRELLGKRA
jgi:hypothetical protein